MKKDPSLNSLWTALKNSKAQKKGNYILIESESIVAFQFLRKEEFKNSLKDIIAKVLGKHYSIGPYKKESEENIENNGLDLLLKDAKSSNIDVLIMEEN